MSISQRTHAVALGLALAAVCPTLSRAEPLRPLESATYRLPSWSQQIAIREG
jgi:hypothetical protein